MLKLASKTDFGALRVCGVQWRAVGCWFLLVHHTKAAKTKTKKYQYFYEMIHNSQNDGTEWLNDDLLEGQGL